MKSLTRQTGKVFLTRSCGMILAFGLNLALTRWLGITAYGGFAYIVSWVMILTIPSVGMETLLVREIAIARDQEYDTVLSTLLRWSLKYTLLMSCALSMTAILVYLLISSHSPQNLRFAFLIGLSGLPLLCLQILAGSIFRGFKRVDQAVLLNEIIVPFLTMIWIGACVLAGWKASLSIALGGRWIVYLLLIPVYVVALLKLIPAFSAAALTKQQKTQWRHSLSSMTLLRSIDVIMTRLPILVLGLLVGPTSVALFSLSARIAESVVFVFVIISMTIAPRVAELHARQDYSAMQRLVTKSTRNISIWAIGVALLLVLTGKWFLGWFGTQFDAAYPILIVLIVGKVFDAVTGNVGLVLTMGGMERVVTKTRAMGLLLTAALCFLLVPFYGAMGSAIACTGALIVWNTILVIQLYRRFGIVTVFMLPHQ